MDELLVRILGEAPEDEVGGTDRERQAKGRENGSLLNQREVERKRSCRVCALGGAVWGKMSVQIMAMFKREPQEKTIGEER